MLLHNLKLTFRSLKNSKLFSFITIFGLSVGMAATILLVIYVKYELSFDKFNAKYDRTYKLINSIIADKSDVLDICIRLNDTTFSQQIPEIESMVQFYFYGDVTLDYAGNKIGNLSQVYADPSVFDVFTFDFLEGNPKSAFSTPTSVVLTKRTAEKMFGKYNALGKPIKIENQMYTVSAVIGDWPSNSNLRFDLLLSKKTIPFLQYLGGAEFITYFTFKEGVDPSAAIEKIRKLYLSELSFRFKESGYSFDAWLQPMSRIHLFSNYQPRVGLPGNITIVYLYLFLAILILTIAIINFINLLTVKHESKTRVISIQKAIGASRRVLIQQTLGQSIAFAFISLFFAAILVEFTIPYFSNLVNRNLVVSYSEDPQLFILLPLLALVVGVISGLYPAILLSKSPSLQLSKNVVVEKKRNSWLTTALVIFQFAVAISLLSCIFIVNDQLKFMKSVNLGLNSKQVIAFGDMTNKLTNSYRAVVDAIGAEPNIVAVSGSHHMPGGGCSGQGIEVLGSSNRKKISINEYRVRGGYFDLLQIEKLEGRFLSDDAEAEQFNLVLNEAAVKALGIRDPLNQQIAFNDEPGFRIVGVVKDFHYASLRQNIEPIVFRTSNQLSYILVKTSSSDIKNVVTMVEAKIKEFDQEYLLNYRLLDDVFRNRYQSEEQSMLLTSLASALAFTLALLGLYALTLFMVNKRVKEIGIRKAIGASSFEVVGMLIWVFTKWIIAAFIIAVPIGYYVMEHWLNGFAYRIDITPWPFAFSGIIALMVALLSVGWQAYKAASRNPVAALKCE